MPTSEVEIMNSALDKLGAEPITDPTDDSNRARLISRSYLRMLGKLLYSHPWRFNKAYVSLALIDPKPADIFDYDCVFQLPANCARVFSINSDETEWEQIGDKYLACNSSEVTIKYGKKITDVTQFDEFFSEVLACAMAADIAYSLTQSAERKQTAQDEYEKILREARSYSAQAGSTKRVGATLWLKSRY